MADWMLALVKRCAIVSVMIVVAVVVLVVVIIVIVIFIVVAIDSLDQLGDEDWYAQRFDIDISQ
jgi:uncharacterized membrane protein (DUF485 family)